MTQTSQPIEALSAADAMSRAGRNRHRRYPSPERDGDRLYPLANPMGRPSFRIGPDDTIFAIGSCFARNVEKVLESSGLRVLSREFSLGQVGDSLGEAANFFNKYSIHSVANDVRWALERDSFPGEEILYPLGKGRYCDPQLGMAKLAFPPEEILDFRHAYLDVIAQVATADVVILTLGYVETWYDTKLDLYLNVSPPAPLVKAEPDRFEFRVLSYEDVLAGLEAFYALLQKHRSKPLKMLLTVSPVPLLSTFRDMDVLVANAYSKSVQRAALEQFIQGKEGVDYFPSYEFVTLSNPTVAWSRGDYRHVSSDIVTRIMSNVITQYIGTPDADDTAPADAAPEAQAQAPVAGDMTPDALLSSARLMLKLEDFAALTALTEQHRDLADAHVDVLLAEATAARKLGDIPAAYAALDKATHLAPGRPLPLERKIMMCRPLQRTDEAQSLMAAHAERFPDRGEFRQRIDWV